MRKLIFIFAIFLLLNLVFAANIDPALEKELKNGKVKVIVYADKNNNLFSTKSVKSENVEKKLSSINAYVATIDENDLKNLKADKKIKAVFPNKKFKIQLQESRNILGINQAENRLINGINITGNGVSVCVIDTGIDYTHKEFGKCNTNKFLNGKCDRVIAGYDFYNNDDDPIDDNGHGTHVSGIIAANGESFRGTAPDSKIVAMKVCDASGNCDGLAIANAIDYCIQNKIAFNISAISISIGSDTLYTNYCDSQSMFTPLVNEASELNITIVAASGNSGSLTGISEPACIENITSVGATYDFTGTYSSSTCNDNALVDKVACFSNRNSITDLLAPGSIINSTSINGGYSLGSGTSFSTPHISGIIALMQQYKKLESGYELNYLDVLNSLKNTGKNVTDNGINLVRADAVKALINVDNKIPDLFIKNPLNNSVQNYTFNLLYYFSDTNLDSCYYSLNDETDENHIYINNCLNISLNTDKVNNALAVFVNDSNGNFNLTDVNFEADVVETTLLEPADDSFFNTNSINFTCRAKTSSLSSLINISVGIDFGNGFIINKTESAAGTSWQKNFALNNLPEGTYNWNCLSFANSSKNSAFASNNYTFTIDSKGPVISSLINSTISSTSTTIKWATNEPGNSTINYGTTQEMQLKSSVNSFVLNHEINLISLSPLTKYYFNATSCDVYGNCGYSSQGTFTTTEADTRAPSIDSISVSSINSTDAVITWTTDENANSTIYYGLTESVTLKTSNITFTTSHSKKLVNLVPSSLYYFNVSSCDLSANCNYSKQMNFTTLNSSGSAQNSGGSAGGSSSAGGGGGGSGNTNPTIQSQSAEENTQSPESQNTNTEQSSPSSSSNTQSSDSNNGKETEKTTSSGFSLFLGNAVKTFANSNFMGFATLKTALDFARNNIIVSSLFFGIIGIAGLVFLMHRKSSFENFAQKEVHKEIVENYHKENNEKL